MLTLLKDISGCQLMFGEPDTCGRFRSQDAHAAPVPTEAAAKQQEANGVSWRMRRVFGDGLM